MVPVVCLLRFPWIDTQRWSRWTTQLSYFAFRGSLLPVSTVCIAMTGSPAGYKASSVTWASQQLLLFTLMLIVLTWVRHNLKIGILFMPPRPKGLQFFFKYSVTFSVSSFENCLINSLAHFFVEKFYFCVEFDSTINIADTHLPSLYSWPIFSPML